MAQSITRWYTSSFGGALAAACQTAIQPYVAAGETDGYSELVYGPADNIPDGQYEGARTWTTTAGAQNWLDMIDGIATSAGCVCLEKRLIP